MWSMFARARRAPGRSGALLVVALLTAALSPSPALAQSQSTSQRVTLPKNAPTLTLKGTLKGYDSVDYLVNAAAGQVLSVHLDTRNPSMQFNILSPGAQNALFIGSQQGTTFTGALPAKGTTAIRIYLMRNAARRGEVADYVLTIGLSDPVPKPPK